MRLLALLALVPLAPGYQIYSPQLTVQDAGHLPGSARHPLEASSRARTRAASGQLPKGKAAAHDDEQSEWCSGDESCSGNGLCSLGRCHCQQGYGGRLCELVVGCPDECSKHGACVEAPIPGQVDSGRLLVHAGRRCRCAEGWTGPACNIKRCPSDCSARGHCTAGMCVCYDGYSGPDCSIGTCHPKCAHGTCTEQKARAIVPGMSFPGRAQRADWQCVCEKDWTGRACDVPLPCAQSDADEHTCGDHGGCRGGVCHCDEGWFGLTCGQRDCGVSCSHGHCGEDGTCVCEPGWLPPDCKVRRCPNDCSGWRGYCMAGGVCSCKPGFCGVDCSQGSLPSPPKVGQVRHYNYEPSISPCKACYNESKRAIHSNTWNDGVPQPSPVAEDEIPPARLEEKVQAPLVQQRRRPPRLVPLGIGDGVRKGWGVEHSEQERRKSHLPGPTRWQRSADGPKVPAPEPDVERQIVINSTPGQPIPAWRAEWTAPSPLPPVPSTRPPRPPSPPWHLPFPPSPPSSPPHLSSPPPPPSPQPTPPGFWREDGLEPKAFSAVPAMVAPQEPEVRVRATPEEPATAPLPHPLKAAPAKSWHDGVSTDAQERARREAEVAAGLEEAEARIKADEQAAARREAREKARKETEDTARADAEAAEAQRVSEARAKANEAENARREAEEGARKEAEARRMLEVAEAHQEAEKTARRTADETARRARQAKAEADAAERARLEREAQAQREKARLAAEAKARAQEAERARLESEERALAEAEVKAHEDAERSRREAETKANEAAGERSRFEADQKARREADDAARAREKASLDAEDAAKAEADGSAHLGVEARAQAERDEAARRGADMRAKAEAERSAETAQEGPAEPKLPGTAYRGPYNDGVPVPYKNETAQLPRSEQQLEARLDGSHPAAPGGVSVVLHQQPPVGLVADLAYEP